MNGDSDLSGRAFVGKFCQMKLSRLLVNMVFNLFFFITAVHAEDGSRVGCGLLADIVDGSRFSTKTSPLTDDNDFGQSDVVVVIWIRVFCFLMHDCTAFRWLWCTHSCWI